MHKPLHPYFKLGKIIFIISTVILILLDSFVDMAIANKSNDASVLLLSLSKINFVIFIFAALLMLMGLWESRQQVADKVISKRTIKIKELSPEDYEAFEAWVDLDLSHKHLRKSSQINKFLAYKKKQEASATTKKL